MVSAHYKRFSEAPLIPTFRNTMMLPGYSKVEPSEVNINTTFIDGGTKGIPLTLPIVASPMDTVSEVKMARAMAERGGIAVVHRGSTAEEQYEMIMAVKRELPLISTDFKTVSPGTRLEDAIGMMEGLTEGLPVVDKDNKLMGIITGKDVRANLTNMSKRVDDEHVMTPRAEIISAGPDITEAQALELMERHKVKKLPILDEDDRLIGLILKEDIIARQNSKNGIKDFGDKLVVAACVSPFDLERAVEISRYADALLIDISHFDSRNVVEATKRIIDESKVWPIIGNLGTKEGVVRSVKALDGRVSALRMGIGGGSICITTNVTSAGAPALFATLEANEAVQELMANGHITHEIPIIADGGIKGAGDMALAFAAGASSVMLGSGLSATDQSPGGLLVVDGQLKKIYRGMGSEGAIADRMAADRYATGTEKRIAEGVEKIVDYKGDVHEVLDGFEEGLRRSISIGGGSDIPDLKSVARIARVDAPLDAIAPKVVGQEA